VADSENFTENHNLPTLQKKTRLWTILSPEFKRYGITPRNYLYSKFSNILWWSVKHISDIFSMIIVDLKDGFWNIIIYDESSKHHSVDIRFVVSRLVYHHHQKCLWTRWQSCLVISKYCIWWYIYCCSWWYRSWSHIRLLFERARQHNVRFNCHKVRFKVRQVKYLGNFISADKTSNWRRTVRAITEMPVPNNKEALLQFLHTFRSLIQIVQR